MTFTDFEFKGGILGQGCYINGFATKPGFYRCKLPALTVLSLMDLGHWQLKSVTGDIYRDEAMQEESWRIDNLLSSINDAQLRLQKGGLQKDGLQENSVHEDKPSQSDAPQLDSNPDMLLPLATLLHCYWRADRNVREQAIVRLQSLETNAFGKRLARVLAQLPETSSSMPAQPDI